MIDEKLAEEHKRQLSNDLEIISSLPSLYPLQSFEEKAIHRVVESAKDTNVTNNQSVKGDLISRQAVIDIIHKEIARTTSYAEHDTQINIKFAVEELPTAYNDGWIPYTTNGKLPKEGQRVWLSFTNELTSYVKDAWWQGKFFVWNNCHIVKETPMAWKPYDVPAPYHPKGE